LSIKVFLLIVFFDIAGIAAKIPTFDRQICMKWPPTFLGRAMVYYKRTSIVSLSYSPVKKVFLPTADNQLLNHLAFLWQPEYIEIFELKFRQSYKNE